MKSKTLEQALKEIDDEYKEFIKNEKREFEKGNRNSEHVTWDGNLW